MGVWEAVQKIVGKRRKLESAGEGQKPSAGAIPVNIYDIPPGQVSRDPVLEQRGWQLDPMERDLYPLEIRPEFLQQLQTLSVLNPDLSQATDNIIRLGNTGYEIKVEGPEKAVAGLLESVKEIAGRIYPLGGGWKGVADDLFGQLARSGAIAIEWVPREDLTDLSHATLVPVDTIRIKAQGDGTMRPVQRIRRRGELSETLIELNTETFVYLAASRTDRSPHAIPPFIAALRNIRIQDGMMRHLSTVVEKVGILGFLQVLVSAPTQKPGEGDDQYRARCETYLKRVVEHMKGSYREGIAVGFKDIQEFQVTPSHTNTQGVDNLWRINEEQVASGLKQDPSMFGRTYSTTETYAGVVLEKTLAQLVSYQRLVGLALERGVWLLALLRGHAVTSLTVEFKPSSLIDEKKAEDVRKAKLENAKAEYDQGLIDQNGVAQRMGIDKPAAPGPIAPAVPPDPGQDNPPPANAKQDLDEEENDDDPALIRFRNFLGGARNGNH